MVENLVDLDDLKNLLIIRLRSLGDTVLMTPVLAALKKWRTHLRLSVLIERPFAPVLEQNPYVDDCVILETRSLSDKFKVLGRLRKQYYDAILNLHGGTSSLVFSLAGRSKYKIGFAHYRYRCFYNVNVPDSKRVWERDDVHTVEHQLAPLKWLGIPVPEAPELDLHVNSESRLRILSKLGERDLIDKKLVVIHPTATLFTKQWDLEKFAALIDHITESYNLSVALTLDRSEREIARHLKTKLQKGVVIFDTLNLSELIALIDQAFLFIGCDSGPTHIAAALKKRIVVIFGSSNSVVWHPWGTRHELVKSNLPCIPCPGDRCYQFDEPKCIKQISVSDVNRAVEKIISHEILRVG